MSGLVIKVKVIKAILTHNTEIGSNMDPFVVLKMGTVQKRGKTFDEAGDMPEFNEQFGFSYKKNFTMLHLIVYDEDTTIDDLVGEVQIDIKPIISQQKTPKRWYSLKYDGKKPAGKIMLEFQCRKDGLSSNQEKKIISQISKPNIHKIGLSQPQIKNQIHYLNQRKHHHNFCRQIDVSENQNGGKKNHSNHPQKVFSFREYNLQQSKFRQAQFNPNNPSSSTLFSNQSLIHSQASPIFSKSQINKSLEFLPAHQNIPLSISKNSVNIENSLINSNNLSYQNEVDHNYNLNNFYKYYQQKSSKPQVFFAHNQQKINN